VTVPQPRKKLIEVALPLDEINAACKADKDRKTGTIRNLHKWFAPMPLPAWRALIFAALVDDPGDDERRTYLLDVIKRLVATGADLPDRTTLDEATSIIQAQFPDGAPMVLDPFCGGGSTLVEAQRLGLETVASDLNPVPTLITRTLTQVLPQVFGGQPVQSDAGPAGVTGRAGRSLVGDSLFLSPGRAYSGYDGLLRDFAYYAAAVRDEAAHILAAHYPTEPGETPIAWLWSRTAQCPNPACRLETLLTTSWWLSKRKGDMAWMEPAVQGGTVVLDIVVNQRTGQAPDAPKTGDGVFACLRCAAVLDGVYLRSEGKAKRLGTCMTAVVVERDGKRSFRAPTERDLAAVADLPVDRDVATVPLNAAGQGIRVGLYGLDTWDLIFTPRQILTLSTFSDIVASLHGRMLDEGASPAWADAVTTLLGLAVGKLAGYLSTQARIENGHGGSNRTVPAFARHDLPMTWDFPEINCLGDKSANWMQVVQTISRAVPHAPTGRGVAIRGDARNVTPDRPCLVATDPPYFDAIGYADLSDYFYLWHRKALRGVHPDLFGTIAAPKAGELTAIPSHHGNSKQAARTYFIEGFAETFRNLQSSMAPDVPMLVVYASKEQQSAKDSEETRWSSILTAMVQADLEITGAWPIAGTGANRMVSLGNNAVASYVVMVTRPRPSAAGTCSLADFNRELRRELKPAVHGFQTAGILPVDLAQAAMGPGMRVYSRYRAVVDQANQRVPVEQALRLINAALGEVLDEQEGELDPYSRFAVAWWERHGWVAAPFGEADQLARPQGISVDDVVRAGVVDYPKPGFVRALGSGLTDLAWEPSRDSHPTAWEAVHHLVDRLIEGGGSIDAGRLMGQLGVLRDPAQALVYRLHDIAAKSGRTKDQERYNALIGSWSDLIAISATEKDGLF
jgi:putative DNA methylase